MSEVAVCDIEKKMGITTLRMNRRIAKLGIEVSKSSNGGKRFVSPMDAIKIKDSFKEHREPVSKAVMNGPHKLLAMRIV